MEQRNNLVLQGTETFSRGALDNVALESGALVLDSSAGRYLPYGSYTTPEFAMPAFCNLNVSWNASAPHNTMVEVRCRVYAGNTWTGWMSFGKWAPDYPRCSTNAQSEDGMIFLLGDTVTVATPGGGTGIQLQVNLSTNDDKSTPAVRLLAAAVRPLTWEKHEGRPLNRRLYLPEYCLSAHDPSFGREMDLQDLRTQIHDDCPVAVRVERRIRGQRDPVGIWMGLRGFGHDDAVMADYVLLNDPTADSDGSVNCTMALSDFLRYFTGRAIALRRKPRDAAADLPNRVRCDLARSEDGRCYYFEQRGQRDLLPDDFSGWTAYTLHDGIAHATTAHRTFRRMERTPDGGLCFPPEQLAAGGRCSVYAVDQTGRMRVAEVRLPAPPRPPAAPPAAPQNDPQSTGQPDP